ncbi:MAG: hypothetical protein EOO70_05010 [Myxococcaceae bacterium]|nr:MAG: hypothetical protein EOO70_05010 [Myxococcaceae bacterium]
MQNIISLNLSAQDLTDLDTALATLQRVTAPMPALRPQQRRNLLKMGDKSEAFCRQTLDVLAANPQIIPPNLDMAEARADMVALDALRPRLAQMQQLLERVDDTVMALGSDVITVAMEGYGLLRVTGKDEALKNLRKDLGSRFRGRGSKPAKATA